MKENALRSLLEVSSLYKRLGKNSIDFPQRKGRLRQKFSVEERHTEVIFRWAGGEGDLKITRIQWSLNEPLLN